MKFIGICRKWVVQLRGRREVSISLLYRYLHPATLTLTQIISYPVISLSLPDPLNSLRNTHIICLKLVQSNQHQHGDTLKTPHERLPCGRVFVSGDVVDDHGFETKVRVDDDSGTENCVGNGANGARGEGSDS